MATLSYEQRLQLALEDLHEKKFPSIARAASAYSVSPRTLGRRVKGGKTRSEGHEHARLLSVSEEAELVRWLEEVLAHNVPARVGMVNGMADAIIQARPTATTTTTSSPGVPPIQRVGSRWYQKFLKRHDALVSQFSRAVDRRPRSVAFTKPMVVVQAWLELFRQTTRKYNVALDDVYNMDETGFAMGVLDRSLVVVSRAVATRSMQQQQPGNQEWVSVLETIGGTGKALPPFLVFKGAHHQTSWCPRQAPEGWKFSRSENGWTTDELGLAWLEQHFDPATRPGDPARYRLLLLDSHSSHKTLEFLAYCRNHRIVVLCLPPDTTHNKLQPLDVGPFSSLKVRYLKAAEERSCRGVAAIEKFRFIELYEQVRAIAFGKEHVERSWEETGLIPFNPQHLFSQFPEFMGRAVVVPAAFEHPTTPTIPRSSAPLEPITPTCAPTTPTNLSKLAPYDQPHPEFNASSSIEASPPAERHSRMVRTAPEEDPVASAVWKQRDQALLAATATAKATSSHPRKRRRMIASGSVLTTSEALDRLEHERWEEGDGTSSEEETRAGV